MISKVIHYCWFGRKPLPISAKKCIESWKRYCPDYEIIEWNESNFDVNKNIYCKEAYEARKFAFVSDYARFEILYKYGGVYFDTDVEILKPIDELLLRGAFMGVERENPISVAPGLGMAAHPGLSIFKEFIDSYNQRSFKLENGKLDVTTVVVTVTNILRKYGLRNSNEIQFIAGISIYPVEYFCPKNIDTGEIKISSNTYTIHHYDGSWLDNKGKIKNVIKVVIGKTFGEKIVKIIRNRLWK